MPGLAAAPRSRVSTSDELVTRFQPSMIVLYVGTNDLMLKRPPEVVVDGLVEFVKRVEKKCPPGTPVIYISIPTTVLHRTWGRRRVDAITAANGMVESFIKGYNGLARLAYVDMDRAGLSKPENFLHDGHHLRTSCMTATTCTMRVTCGWLG